MKIDLQQTIALLLQGQVVGLPTETVYGIAACLRNRQAIEKIFELKNRPLTNPLIIHLAAPEDLQEFTTNLPPDFHALSEAFWPGPLTLILPIDESTIPPIARANLPTAAFRIPDQPLTREVIAQSGPLVMPSANLSGRPSSTSPEHVEQDFGPDFPVLDGGKCQRGLESTILCYQHPAWVIARMGSLAAEDFQSVLGYIPENMTLKNESKPICPGQLLRHYAPRAKLYLNADELEKTASILGFADRIYPKNHRVFILGSINQPQEIAHHLYDALRRLDEEGVQSVWVDMDFPQNGLWKTIHERIKRAAGQ